MTLLVAAALLDAGIDKVTVQALRGAGLPPPPERDANTRTTTAIDTQTATMIVLRFIH